MARIAANKLSCRSNPEASTNAIPVRSCFLKPPITAHCVLSYHFQTQESKPSTQSAEANTFLGNISIDHSFSSTIQTITPSFTLTNQTLSQLNSFLIASRKRADKLASIPTADFFRSAFTVEPYAGKSRDKAHSIRRKDDGAYYCFGLKRL